MPLEENSRKSQRRENLDKTILGLYTAELHYKDFSVMGRRKVMVIKV